MQNDKSNTNGIPNNSISHQGLIGFMKSFRIHLMKQYIDDYYIGSIYYGDNNITYFPFTPKDLKKQKLKIAIVFNHQDLRFEVWLAGQNKQIQKQYWEIFKDSDWHKYHIPSTITDGFSIVDHILVVNPEFDNYDMLAEQIEAGALEFIKEIEYVLR